MGRLRFWLLTGLAVDAWKLPLFGLGYERAFYLDSARICVRLAVVKGWMSGETIPKLKWPSFEGRWLYVAGAWSSGVIVQPSEPVRQSDPRKGDTLSLYSC